MDEAGFENRVGDAFYTMRSNPGAFGSNSTLRMAYFWDVMDDRFPELFQAVQHQPDFGQAVTVAEYYFLFVRQVFNSDGRGSAGCGRLLTGPKETGSI